MILTLSGVSCAGKTSIAKGLLGSLPVDSEMLKSYTTMARLPRESDLPGEYKYISKFRFWWMEKNKSFLWTAHPFGKSYGTTEHSLIRALKHKDTISIMILIPKIIGTLRNFIKERDLLDEIVSVYVLASPEEILRQRFEDRGDSPEEIEKRLAECVRWDQDALSSGVPYEFVRNDGKIQEAVEEVAKRFLQRYNSCDNYF